MKRPVLLSHPVRLAAISAFMLASVATDVTKADDASKTAALQTTDGGAMTEQEKEAELVKKTLNPVADLISVPIQNNWDFGIGPKDATKFTANIQPVVPIGISEDWNLIIRTILPVISMEEPVSGYGDHCGLGDTTQSFFLSPKKPWHDWILGAGPVGYYPTATESELGAGQWGAGPTVVALQQKHGWTYGILANHVWSVGGWGDDDISATYLQPFVGYSTKKFTTFMVNTESTYDWEEDEWTVPVNFMITQMLKIGKQPLTLQLGYRCYADRPSGGPDWGLRFAVTFLFPKH